jgi:DNA-directed RNA polymerase alpha subunit
MSQNCCKVIRESKQQLTTEPTTTATIEPVGELESLRQQLREQREDTARLKEETVQILWDVHMRTAKLSGLSKCSPPEEVAQLREEVLQHLTRLEEERIFLVQFVQALNMILELQPFRDLRSGMTDILDCLAISR